VIAFQLSLPLFDSRGPFPRTYASSKTFSAFLCLTGVVCNTSGYRAAGVACQKPLNSTRDSLLKDVEMRRKFSACFLPSGKTSHGGTRNSGMMLRAQGVGGGDLLRLYPHRRATPTQISFIADVAGKGGKGGSAALLMSATGSRHLRLRRIAIETLQQVERCYEIGAV